MNATNHSRLWTRIMVIIGSIGLLAGALDPLEGSVAIFIGSGLVALGTFLAGVLLAESEYRHALESDIDPFKGLLLGLFFISVGMSIDVGLILDQPFLFVPGTNHRLRGL